MSEPLEAWIAEQGEAIIWADFPRGALEDGERLLRAQAVLDSSPGGQGFFARVQADRRHVYSVDCRVHPLPSPKPVTTYCTCAVGGGCAHAVAALLFYLGRKTPAGLVQANPAVHQWLSELDHLGSETGASHAVPSAECLVYLLDDDGAGHITVTPRRARPRRRGGYGRLMAFQGLRRAPEGLLGADDRRLLRLLPESGQGISPEDLNFLLAALAKTGRAHWQRTEVPALSASGKREGTFAWRVEPDGSQRLVPVAGDNRHAYPALPPVWLDTTTGEFGTIETGLSLALVERLQSGPAVAPADVPAMADGLVQRGLPVPAPRVPSRRRIDDIAPAPCLRLTRLNGGAHALRVDAGEPVAEVGFDYAGHTVAADDPAETVSVYEQGELLEYRRDKPAESRAIEQLESAGLERAGCMAGDRFVPGHSGGWRAFVAETLPRLQETGWQVTTEPVFPWRLAEVAMWQVEARHAKDPSGWFTFDLSVEVDGERHALLPLLLALIRENPEAMSTRYLDAIDPASSLLVDLGDGRLIPVPADRLVPLLRGLTELYDPAIRLDQGRLRLPLGRANALEDLAGRGDQALHWQGDEDLRVLGRKLAVVGTPTEVPIPQGLRGELRPYQREGLAWLQQLAQIELGGVLADDMGLGKTLQVLAHLQLEKEAGRARAPSLIIVPTSLMFNWAREAEKFTPDLRVLRLHGPQRHAEYERLGRYDLVLTTYSLLVRDIARLHGQPWHLLVLDEAQAVKNPRAQAARAVRTLSARQRLSLTGTPLENHLGELWAQFDFVAPGLLGNASAFKRTYRRPIEQDRDDSRLVALRERVTPFLMRRTKQAIAQDLPPKTEIPLYAELVGGQRDLYEQLRLGQQARVREALAEQGHPQSRVLILDALLKLREACCDPRLVANAPQVVRESAKLELLLELLDDLMQAGRRVIVFSQFTRMLTIIEQALNERGHVWTKLTGETRDREAAVTRFQAGDVPIFLVSLKAGGTGLNLTAADTVIHYDPWWNPAVTRQATDRAHRIGQDQPVFVYHLLTRDTVEDRIMALQKDKAELGERLLGEADNAPASPLDAEAVSALFGPLADDASAEHA